MAEARQMEGATRRAVLAATCLLVALAVFLAPVGQAACTGFSYTGTIYAPTGKLHPVTPSSGNGLSHVLLPAVSSSSKFELVAKPTLLEVPGSIISMPDFDITFFSSCSGGLSGAVMTAATNGDEAGTTSSSASCAIVYLAYGAAAAFIYRDGC